MNHLNRLIILAFHLTLNFHNLCSTVTPAVLAAAALAAPVAGGFFLGLSSRMIEEKYDFRGDGYEDGSLGLYLHKLYHTSLISALGAYAFIYTQRSNSIDIAGTVSLLAMHAYSQGRNVWVCRDNRQESLLLTRKFAYLPQIAIGFLALRRTPGASEYVKGMLELASYAGALTICSRLF